MPTDGWTDGYDEANCRVSPFCEHAEKENIYKKIIVKISGWTTKHLNVSKKATFRIETKTMQDTLKSNALSLRDRLLFLVNCMSKKEKITHLWWENSEELKMYVLQNSYENEGRDIRYQ